MTKELVTKTVMAWHFTNGERISHTGEPLVHRTYTVDPPLELCARGLHASRNPMDALRLGPGLHVSRVRLSGTILDDGIEKLCASRRTVIWHADASLAVIAWGAWCAREVLHLFEMKYPGDLRPRHAVEATEAYVAAARAARTSSRPIPYLKSAGGFTSTRTAGSELPPCSFSTVRVGVDRLNAASNFLREFVILPLHPFLTEQDPSHLNDWSQIRGPLQLTSHRSR